jgi:ABC-type uncharacterized transport system substrate-binding protein
MRRRKFIALLGSVAAWSLAARAQQPDSVRRVGVLTGLRIGDRETDTRLTAFRRTLRGLGWSEGRNVRIDFADGEVDQARTMGKELMSSQPDVLVADGTPALKAVLSQTDVVPVVFLMVADPVGQGIVKSLARPGANVTGFTNFEPAMGGKWLELLKEVTPGIVRVMVIYNPETAPGGGLIFVRPVEAACKLSGLELVRTPVRNEEDIRTAIAGAAPGNGLMILPDVFTDAHRVLIIQLAAGQQLPTIYPFPTFVASGGLMSYGVNAVEEYRQAATYVDRILRGEKPGELPIQAPTKFELVINMKTAKALGLTISPSLLARADEVIE